MDGDKGLKTLTISHQISQNEKREVTDQSRASRDAATLSPRKFTNVGGPPTLVLLVIVKQQGGPSFFSFFWLMKKGGLIKKKKREEEGVTRHSNPLLDMTTGTPDPQRVPEETKKP